MASSSSSTPDGGITLRSGVRLTTESPTPSEESLTPSEVLDTETPTGGGNGEVPDRNRPGPLPTASASLSTVMATLTGAATDQLVSIAMSTNMSDDEKSEQSLAIRQQLASQITFVTQTTNNTGTTSAPTSRTVSVLTSVTAISKIAAIKQFDPGNERFRPRRYFGDIERQFTSLEIPKAHWLACFQSKCSAAVVEFISGIEEGKVDWNTLKTHLCERYSPTDDPTRATEELYNFTQKRKETIPEMLTRYLSLVNESHMGNMPLEEIVNGSSRLLHIRRFIHALRDDNIRQRFHEFNAFNPIESIYKAAQTCSRLQVAYTNADTGTKSKTPSKSTSGTGRNNGNNNGSNGSHTTPGSGQSTHTNSKARLKCFKCGRPGHKLAECTSKATPTKHYTTLVAEITKQVIAGDDQSDCSSDEDDTETIDNVVFLASSEYGYDDSSTETPDDEIINESDDDYDWSIIEPTVDSITTPSETVTVIENILPVNDDYFSSSVSSVDDTGTTDDTIQTVLTTTQVVTLPKPLLSMPKTIVKDSCFPAPHPQYSPVEPHVVRTPELDYSGSQTKGRETYSPKVMVFNQKMTALLDTGCTHTLANIHMASRLQLPLIPIKKSITINIGNRQLVPQHCVRLVVSHDHCQVEMKVPVVELPMGIPLLIGNDTQEHLGMVIYGINTEEYSDAITGITNDIDETHFYDTNSGTIFLSNEQMDTITQGTMEAKILNGQLPDHSRCTRPDATMSLTLKDPNERWFTTQYRMSHDEEIKWNERITMMLDKGIIEPAGIEANGINNNHVVCKKKNKDGEVSGLRFSFNGIPLNQRLVDGNMNNVPTITEVFEQFPDDMIALYQMDLSDAYTVVTLERDSRKYTAFTAPNGSRYWYCTMIYGMSPASGIMQELISNILNELDFIGPRPMGYIDDVAGPIFSTEQATHDINLVINAFTAAGIRINFEKSCFGVVSGIHLGHRFAIGTTSADENKVTAIANYPLPVTAKQLGNFLGICQFLSHYIPDLANIAKPLQAIKQYRQLTKHWNDDCTRAFELLKTIISQRILLYTPDYSIEFAIATDASQYALGGICYQVKNNKVYIVSMFSKQFTGAQLVYPAVKKELLAIIQCVVRFRRFIHGRHFHLYTDAKALVYMQKQKSVKPMLHNWFHILNEHRFTIHHRPGIHNVLPDLLSRIVWTVRQQPLKPPVLPANAVKLTKYERRPKLPTETTVLIGEVDDVHEAALPVPVVAAGAPVEVEPLPPAAMPIALNPGFERPPITMDTYARTVKSKTIPDEDKRAALIEAEHSKGHFGFTAIAYNIFQQGYWWMNLFKDCKTYVDKCMACQTWMIKREGFHPATTTTHLLPGDQVSMDTMGPYPQTDNGNVFIHLQVDSATKFVELRAKRTNGMEDTVKCSLSIWSTTGFPKSIKSDNGVEFVNSMTKYLTTVMGIHHYRSLPAYPQGNGAAERHVGTVKDILRKCITDVRNWDEYLPLVQYYVNRRRHAVTGSSPYELYFGRTLTALVDYTNFNPIEYDDVTFHKVITGLSSYMNIIVYPAIQQRVQAITKLRNKRLDAKRRVDDAMIPVGTWVLLRNNAAIRGAFDKPWDGPYKVLHVGDNNTYTLQHIDGSIVPTKKARNALRIVKYDGEIEIEARHTVHKIISHSGEGLERKYLVRWKDLQVETWEPAINLAGCQELLNQYWITFAANGGQVAGSVMEEVQAHNGEHSVEIDDYVIVLANVPSKWSLAKVISIDGKSVLVRWYGRRSNNSPFHEGWLSELESQPKALFSTRNAKLINQYKYTIPYEGQIDIDTILLRKVPVNNHKVPTALLKLIKRAIEFK